MAMPKSSSSSERIFDVVCFTVCRGIPVEIAGQQVINAHISRTYSTLKKARHALSLLKYQYPDAVIWKGTAYFTDNNIRRQAFLRSLA